MGNYRQNKLKKLFKFSFIQENEKGEVEVLFFTDENGKEFSTVFDPNYNYGQGILVEVDEHTYKTSPILTLSSVISAKVVASEIELVTKEEVIQEVRQEEKEDVIEPIIKTLFKRNGDLYFKESENSKPYLRIRYTDANSNNTYISGDDAEKIFGGRFAADYVVLEYAESDFNNDYVKTRRKYPNDTFTNIRPASIRTGKLLDPKEYDYKILAEIFEGQARKDERFIGDFFEIYRSITNKNEVVEAVTEVESEVKTITQVQTEEKASSNNEGWKRGAAKREAQRQQVKTELAEALNRIQELEKLLAEQKRENQELSSELNRIQNDYKRLRNIFDGEDDNYFASIHTIA